MIENKKIDKTDTQVNDDSLLSINDNHNGKDGVDE